MSAIPETVESVEELEEYDRVAVVDIGGTLAQHNSNGGMYMVNTFMGIDPDDEFAIYSALSFEYGMEGKHHRHAGRQASLIDEAEHDFETDRAAYNAAVRRVVNNTEIPETSFELLEELEDQGYTPLLVSSAPVDMARLEAGKLGAPHVYRWKDIEFDGENFDNVYVNPEAKAGKQQVVHGLKTQGIETFAIGNGLNDKRAVEVADNGLMRKENEDIEDFHQDVMEAIG